MSREDGSQRKSDDISPRPQPFHQPSPFRERRAGDAVPEVHLQVAALERHRRRGTLRPAHFPAGQPGHLLREDADAPGRLQRRALHPLRAAPGFLAHAFHARCLLTVGVLRGAVFPGDVLWSGAARVPIEPGQGGGGRNVARSFCDLLGVHDDAPEDVDFGCFRLVAVLGARHRHLDLCQGLPPSHVATGNVLCILFALSCRESLTLENPNRKSFIG